MLMLCFSSPKALRNKSYASLAAESTVEDIACVHLPLVIILLHKCINCMLFGLQTLPYREWSCSRKR